MKQLVVALFSLFMVAGAANADQPLGICKGDYALCAASPSTPTGRTIVVNGKRFREGMAVCPVLNGAAIANLKLMNRKINADGSCDTPDHTNKTVWSLFGVPAETQYPQAPTWAVAPAQFRSFTIGTTPETGMSNQWSFPCQVQAQPVNGAKLASCYGPIMESPWTSNHVKPGQIGFTQAAPGSVYPVGGNAISLDGVRSSSETTTEKK